MSSRSYKVQAGDTLYKIAARMLEDARRWKEIAEINGIRNARRLRVGQNLKLPGVALMTATPRSPEVGSRVYAIQKGDTLAGIAQRLLGNRLLWPQIAKINQISDPRRLQVGDRILLPEADAGPSGGPRLDQVRFIETSERVEYIEPSVSGEGERQTLGRKHGAGLYRAGEADFDAWEENATSGGIPAELRPADLRLMRAVSRNEGAFDAVNTWDSHFFSFGIFQWTAGAAGAPGELPALFALLKQRNAGVYQMYFGQYGLEPELTNAITGWLRLHGRRLVSQEDKQQLRNRLWAYRAVLAGRDARVQTAQIIHALSRLDRFYPAPARALGNLSLADLITSEYGVALLLDNHVNRPAYVHGTVAAALGRLGWNARVVAADPAAREAQLLKQYVEERERYGRMPMTHARLRAERLAAMAEAGELSPEPGSFRPLPAPATTTAAPV